jgi:hypothetical protein
LRGQNVVTPAQPRSSAQAVGGSQSQQQPGERSKLPQGSSPGMVRDGRAFGGLIPASLLTQLRNTSASGSAARAAAAQQLTRALGSVTDAAPLVPHMRPLLEIAARLLEDNNHGVAVQALALASALVSLFANSTAHLPALADVWLGGLVPALLAKLENSVEAVRFGSLEVSASNLCPRVPPRSLLCPGPMLKLLLTLLPPAHVSSHHVTSRHASLYVNRSSVVFYPPLMLACMSGFWSPCSRCLTLVLRLRATVPFVACALPCSYCLDRLSSCPEFCPRG